ncbi:hypothetical protein SELMODRAFT_422681 [Selaginella moellendorffii]|uniref:Protein kinase domain-containing protein n=1 Tax=Selaginella moellendorffii TaxID=88036 RepID=D8SJ72_SELML|nr:hypothetical protein SELMODRAFT_422681 [Selaginella moellendorffii]
MLQGLTVSGDAHKIFSRVAGYLYYKRGHGSTPSGMSREEDVFQVSDHVVFDMNSPPQDAGSPTFFEALFLMHLMFQESSLPLPQQNLDQPFPRRKRIKYSSAGPNTVNARSRIHKEQAVDLRTSRAGVGFSLVNKSRSFGGDSKAKRLSINQWMCARLPTSCERWIWLTIMQDIGGTSIDKNYEELYKDSYPTAAKSALSVIHRANATHGRVESSNIIVGEGGKVMWIDLEAACFFGSDGDADGLLHFVCADLKEIPVCRSN